MTSGDSPLRIAEVPVVPHAGCLGLTTCPGKKDPGRGWNRVLADDLAAIRSWGARTVLTLIEEHEFALLSIPTLGEEVTALGMTWHHLPIRDVDIPDARFETAWQTVGPVLHGSLDAGERILIHCRGGLGRTGLVAARILIERGCAPREAISRVRAARPHAIETVAQERYVLQMKKGSAGRNAWQQQ